MCISVLMLCLFCSCFAGSYGPDSWATANPECREKNQSPIDIIDQDAKVSTEYQELTLDGFEAESSNKTSMKNTGKTGGAQFCRPDPPKVFRLEMNKLAGQHLRLRPLHWLIQMAVRNSDELSPKLNGDHGYLHSAFGSIFGGRVGISRNFTLSPRWIVCVECF